MKLRIIVTFSAIMMLATACHSQPNSKASNTPILGIWRCQMDGLPAVTLNLTDENGSLAGAILFYLHRRDPGQPVTASPGVPEPLFNPMFDGKTLTFQVSHRRAHPPGSLGDRPVTFQLKLHGDGKAALINENESDPNAPAFIFTKNDY
jgi:hypothetical protein